MNGARPIDIAWRDLLPLSRREVANELTLSLPWLAGSIWFYHRGAILPGAFCSFYFFLTGLRQSHGAQHYTLGISRAAHEWALFALSLAMMGSMHAVQVSHLHHHRHCLGDDDHEGSVAKGRWWQALAGGPLFILGLHRNAWRLGSPRARRWIAAELTCAAVLAVFAVIAPAGLACHISAMLVGECFTGFFAVWSVHHDCEDPAGRTQHGRWLNRLTYNMLFHREHHLYPAVPTRHLNELAARLEANGHGPANDVLTLTRRKT